MAVAIKIENLSKQYRLGLVSTRTLSHDLNRWWQTSVLGREDPYLKIGETNVRELKGESEYIWALKDINIEVEEGEVLGIIGRNGAGKSTLLKILSKVTAPTTGIVKARGRIASLLEVGTGFHQEMTGRENIYMNGAIMGMSKSEIRRKFDEIVSFAGVERYIDTPVKRYSSGMTVRLGFSVAAHLEPEILVVDEVLAVGDAEFQKKAIGKMQDVSRKEGRTILFVSHNMGSLESLCSLGVLLGNGEIIEKGEIANIIDQYLGKEFAPTNLLEDTLAEYNKTEYLSVTSIYLTNSKGSNVTHFRMGEEIFINVEIDSKTVLEDFSLNIRLSDSYSLNIAAWRTGETLGKMISVFGKKRFTLKVIHLPVFPGIYYLSLSCMNFGKNLFYIDRLIRFDITPQKILSYSIIPERNLNIIYTDCEWIIS